MQSIELLQRIKNEDFDGMEFFGESENETLRVEGMLGSQELIDEVPFGIYLMNRDGMDCGR